MRWVGVESCEIIYPLSLQRPALFELIADANAGNILLIEEVDRLFRLNESDWAKLKQSLNEKHIRVVALDLPTSWMITATPKPQRACLTRLTTRYLICSSQ